MNDVDNNTTMNQRLSYAENFEIFRQFVTVRANTEASRHEILFRNHNEMMTDPDFKKVLNRYFDDSKVKVFFGNNSRQQRLLENSLSSLYYLSYRATANEAFASSIVKTGGFNIVIRNEAKNLLSGTRSYSTEVAAKEVAKFREKNQTLTTEISMLKKLNLDLVNRLSNVVNHLKVKFGLSEVEIRRIEIGSELKQGFNGIRKSNDPNLSI